MGIKALQIWCRRVTEEYDNVNIIDMSTSWKNGLGFCAVIHHFRPNLIGKFSKNVQTFVIYVLTFFLDYTSLKKDNILENNQLAFNVAEEKLGIPSLLDPWV